MTPLPDETPEAAERGCVICRRPEYEHRDRNGHGFAAEAAPTAAEPCTPSACRSARCPDHGARNTRMSAEPDAGDVAWKMLAGVRCQAIHQQIAGAWCVNCESWARTIGEPHWRPSLAALLADARREGGDEALREAAEATDAECFCQVGLNPASSAACDGITDEVAAWLRARIARSTR